MKKHVVFILFLLCTSAAVQAAEVVHVKVRQLMCTYCAQRLRDAFRRQKAVQSIEMAIPDHIMTLNLKDEQTIADKKIQKLVGDLDYKVLSITRETK